MIRKKLPDFDLDGADCCGDIIVGLYKSFGWNPDKQEVDSSKFIISPSSWYEIAGEFKRKWGLEAALAWMNYGPSVDERREYHLAQDEIMVLPGALLTESEAGR